MWQQKKNPFEVYKGIFGKKSTKKRLHILSGKMSEVVMMDFKFLKMSNLPKGMGLGLLKWQGYKRA